ncbi:MAG: lysophospholipid acyltransferase family protein, partial [Phycisphaerae bacterium]
YMIAREFYEIPVIGRLIRLIDCMPVNRSGIDTASVKAALRHLKNNKVLGIFPQGGIRPVDDTAPPRDGVGMLALRSGAAVIPAYVSGMTYRESVLGALVRRQRVVVRYGPPVDLSRWRGRESQREAYREVAAEIMQAIRALKRTESPRSTADQERV